MIPTISYQAHCENIGWQNPVTEGVAGTTGKSLRLEALRIHLNHACNASLSFDVHLENDGWKFNLCENDLLGTTGKCKRMEAIVIRSKGLIEQGYRIQYKVHIQNFEWLRNCVLKGKEQIMSEEGQQLLPPTWVNEGEMAGTTGRALRMEAIQIRLIQAFPAIKNYTINNNLTLMNVQFHAEKNDYNLVPKCLQLTQ